MGRIGAFWPVVLIVLSLCAGILYMESKVEDAEKRCGVHALVSRS